MKEDFIGFKTLLSKDIKCGDCGTKLANIELIEDNQSRINRGKKPNIVQYKINNCIKCNGSSFWSDFFDGTSIAGSINDSYLLESEDVETDGNVIKVTLKCQKKNQKS